MAIKPELLEPHGRATGYALPPALLAQLATAVARPGSDALLLSAENKALGRVSLSEAIGSARAYCVEVGDEVLALDCDNPSAASRVRALYERLESLGLRPALLGSGQPGRFHLFARVMDPLLMRVIASEARQLHFDRRHGGARIRPPGSPHRLGLPVAFLAPQDAVDALERLQDELSGPQRLPNRIAKLALDGDPKRYASRSEADSAIAASACQRGWNLDGYSALLRSPDFRCSDRTIDLERAKGAQAAERYVRRTWTRAVEFTASSPPIKDRNSARQFIRSLIRACDDGDWRGRSGPTDRAVLQAHLGIAYATGRLEHDASCRDVAERAGVSAATVRNSWKRLRRAGYLRSRGRQRARDATRWRLTLPAGVAAPCPHSLTPPTGISVGNYAPAGLGADAWRWGALGHTRRMTWEALGQHAGVTVKDLAHLRRLSPRTTREHLQRLGAVGLAKRDSGGGWHRLTTDLGHVACGLGIAGKSASQRRRHEHERATWRQAIERHRLASSEGTPPPPAGGDVATR